MQDFFFLKPKKKKSFSFTTRVKMNIPKILASLTFCALLGLIVVFPLNEHLNEWVPVFLLELFNLGNIILFVSFGNLTNKSNLFSFLFGSSFLAGGLNICCYEATSSLLCYYIIAVNWIEIGLDVIFFVYFAKKWYDKKWNYEEISYV